MSLPATPDEEQFVFGPYAAHLIRVTAGESGPAEPEREAPVTVSSDDDLGQPVPRSLSAAR